MNSIKIRSGKAVFMVFFVSFFLILSFPAAWAQSSFSQGEELFMQNRPQEALRFLEAAVLEDPAHVQAFLYLGIAYLQLNRLDDAIETYRRILPRAGMETARVAFNLGNAYFMQGNHELAGQYFSRAIEADPAHAPARLNRANALVRTGELADALVDYEIYLSLQPLSPQRSQVERIMGFIREEFAAAERQRIEAEERQRIAAEQAARAAEEAARVAEEAARAAEEAARAAELAAIAEAERRRRLLEEVAGSLLSATELSTALSIGSEEVEEFYGEFEME